MSIEIERVKKIRLYLIDSINDLSSEQVNEVPSGFNNNIVWNLGHLIAAQQGVCYTRAGLKSVVDEKYTLLYKSGTKPREYVGAGEVETIKKLLLSSLDLLETDNQNGLFVNYVPWTTRYGVELSNIKDTLDFLMYHEGLHSGVIMSIKRLVKK